MLKISDKKSFVINLVLGIILGTTIFAVPFKFVEIIPTTSITSIMQVTGEILTQSSKLQTAWLGLFAIVVSLTLLVLNKRLALTVAGWVFLLLLMGFLILNKESKYLVISYQTFRNVGYLYLFLYLITHLVVHSIAWFAKRKRKILTIWGVVNWIVLFFLIDFAYALATLK